MKKHGINPEVVTTQNAKDKRFENYLRNMVKASLISSGFFDHIGAIGKRGTRSFTGYVPSGVRTYHKPTKYCVRGEGGRIVEEFGQDKRKAKAKRNWLNGTLDGGPYHVSMVR